MKKVTLLLLFLCTGYILLAQGRFSIAGNIALPVGDFGDAVEKGFGGSLRYESSLSGNLTWNASGAYLIFPEKEISGITQSATMIPITGGVKYYTNEAFKGFYGGIDLGAYLVKAKVSYDDQGTTIEAEVDETEFGLAFSVGYHISSFDFQAGYNIAGDLDFINVRVAFVLPGGN